jgi:outer membrane autotransporter protein
MGNDAGGRTLRACLGSLPTVCVDFQVVVGASGLVAIAGSPLVGAPGRPLSREMQVRAINAQGIPIPQEIVNWTVVNPGASPGTFAANPSAPTDAQGLTRNAFTMGNDVGGRTLRACLATLPSVCADFPVRSLNAAVERPTAKIMSPLAELAVATPLAQLNNVRFRLEQLRQRRNPSVVDALRVRVAGQSLPSLSAFALAPLDKNGRPVPQKGGGAAADDPFERLGIFVNGDVEIGRQSRTNVQTGYDLNTKGLTVGADYRLPGDSVVGVAAGFMNANTDLAEAGGSQSARGYSLSAYGSFVPASGGAYIDVIAHAGGNKYDTRRREITDAGLPVDYNSNTRGNQYALAISAGADFNRGALTMNPYLRMDYVNARINQFSESGDDGAIRVGDLDLKNTVVTLGGQLSYAVSTSWGVLMPNARLELQRRVQGEGRNVSAQLVADGTVNAQVQLESVDKNYGNVSVGFSAVLPRGVSGFANYERLFGREGYSNSKYTVGVRFEF